MNRGQNSRCFIQTFSVVHKDICCEQSSDEKKMILLAVGIKTRAGGTGIESEKTFSPLSTTLIPPDLGKAVNSRFRRKGRQKPPL